MYSLNTFIRTTGPIPEVKKKSTLTNDRKNTAYWEVSEESKVFSNNFAPNTVGGSGGSPKPRKIVHFFPFF